MALSPLEHLASYHSAAADANTDETNALVNSLRDQLSQAYADAERDRQVWQNELSSMREVFGSAEKQRCRNQQTLSCQIVALRLREHFISLRGCIQLWALNVVNHGRSVLATRLHNFERQLADDRSCEPYEIEAEQLLSESSCWSEASSRTQSPIGTPSHSSTSPLSIAIPADTPDLIATTDSEHAYRNWKTRRRSSIKQPSFGPFEFVKSLGVGSCGSVLLVQTTQGLGVLKYIRRTAPATAGRDLRAVQSRLNRRLSSELKALQMLNHPFIVGLKMHATTQTHLCLLLEYLPGGDLFDLLENELSAEQVRFYAANVAMAVEHLSASQMAYRDLKPENLAVRWDGYLVLIDLGLVADVSQEKSYTMCGTPEYMAPEQIRGIGHDHCVDWWGLGVLVYEMATGSGPFAVPEDTSVYDVYELVLSFQPQSLRIPGGSEWTTCTQLVQALLVSEPSSRLGCQEAGFEQLKAHPFFDKWHWDAMMHGTIKAPHVPLPEEPQINLDASTKVIFDVFELGFEMQLTRQCGAPLSPQADFSPSSPLSFSPTTSPSPTNSGKMSPPPVMW